MHRSILLAAASLGALAATPAFAQSIPDADDGAIIVTAQRREQNLIEVPASVTALDGQFLDDLGLNDFEELGRFIPGLDVQNQSPNNPGFVLRGITSDSGESFVEPRVSVYQDGVPISKARGSFVELFDLARVEVVRGPQSTLYGRGALIGAINLVQNRANPDAFQGYARFGYGNFEALTGEGMLNIPLSDSAALRFAGRVRSRDGYTPNLLGGEDFNSIDTAAFRGAFHIETGGITFDLIGNYQQDNPAGTAFTAINFRQTDPTTGAVLQDFIGPEGGAALAASPNFPDGGLGLDREVYGVTAILRAELSSSLTLTSTSAWREFNSLEVFDADGISLPYLTAAEDARGEQYTQEFRLSFDNGGPLTGFVGVNYFHDSNSQRTPAQFDERVLLARVAGALNGGGLIAGRPATDPAPLSLFGNTAFTSQLLRGIARNGIAAQVPVGTPNRDAIIDAQLNGLLPTALATAIAGNLKPNHLETLTNSAETDSFDIFADATWRVSPTFEIGAGIRYTRDDKSSALSSAVLNGRSIAGGVVAALTGPGLTTAQRAALLQALGAPGAATIPPSAQFPVPLFGIGFQPTNNNGDTVGADLTDEGVTWRLTARWAVRPDTSLYATYARGRRPEVLSAGAPAAPFAAPTFEVIDAETVDSFEVGVRHQRGSRLYLDGSFFYQLYDNFQTVQQVGTQFITLNAGKAEGYGVELQARWRPIPELQLFGTYSYNHNRFSNGAYDGNRFRLSPDHSLSLGARVELPVGPGVLDFTPSVTYQSSVFFDNDNDIPTLQTGLVPDLIQDEFQDAYALVNARLGYTFNDRFRIEAFVNNVFDEAYIKDAGNTGDGIGNPTFIAGEPQTYGVEVSVRF